MSALPTRLSFLRTIINKIRPLLWKILGVEQPRALIELLNEYPPQSIDNEQTMAYQLWKILGVEQPRGLVEQLSAFSPQSLVDEQMMVYRDRLALMESHVNWRLYGMPAKIHNVKLEQAALISASGEVEWALETFRNNSKKPPQPILDNIANVQSAFIFPGDENVEWDYFQDIFNQTPNITIIEDTSDLYRTGAHPTIKEQNNVQVLSVTAGDVTARLADPEFDLVWLSSVLERVTPIQAQILLKHAFNALRPEGVCAGVFEEYTYTNAGLYWMDVRRIRPITSEYINFLAKNAGFQNIKIKQHSPSSTRFTYQLKAT